MAVYWCDPFLEATTQGNGTTDTTTQDGSYAAPFSINSFWSHTSGYRAETINGTTLSDGDELRFKGLPFSTLFESKGNVYYSETLFYSPAKGTLKPVSGNSSFDATISTSKSSLFAFKNSDISSYLPGWSHPMWIGASPYSSSTEMQNGVGVFLWAVLKEQLGYTSDSSTGMELYRLKDTYANSISTGTSSPYWLSMQNKVTLTAGWTSTTAQDGYSPIEMHNEANYRYQWFNYSSSSKTIWDMERAIICNAAKSTSYNQNNCYVYLQYYFGQDAQDHVFASYTSGNRRAGYFYGDDYLNSTTVFPYIGGEAHWNRSTELRIQFIASNNSHGNVTFKNLITQGKLIIYNMNSTAKLKFGNVYATSNDDTDGKNRICEVNRHSNYIGTGEITYLQNSCYFFHSDGTSQASPILLQVDPNEGITEIYETGLKKPGIAPFNNLTADTSDPNAIYGPHSTGSSANMSYVNETRILNTSNEWTVPALGREGNLPITYATLEKLICNSNNYKTTAHNIKINTPSAIGFTDAPKYGIWSFEHNDYDGKTVAFIGNPYVAGDTYGVLMYNDTVSSTDVLVGQWSGTTGGVSNNVYIPLELSVPSYTAGSDNLRVTVSAAYSNGGSGSQNKIRLIAHHRDSTQSNNFRAYSSADIGALSSDVTSPTTGTLNLTNVPSSGQEDITSVIVGIELQFTSNTNIQKFYITNIAVETY